MIIQIAIAIFLMLEFSNVVALYFKPEMSQANAMGAFKIWQESKSNSAYHDLLSYMAYWVAGTKLIFISLLVVILLLGSELVQFVSLIVLIVSIISYYWRLMPLMNKMDSEGYIVPEGYSKTLTSMITAFIVVLSLAGIVDFFIF